MHPHTCIDMGLRVVPSTPHLKLSVLMQALAPRSAYAVTPVGSQSCVQGPVTSLEGGGRGVSSRI